MPGLAAVGANRSTTEPLRNAKRKTLEKRAIYEHFQFRAEKRSSVETDPKSNTGEKEQRGGGERRIMEKQESRPWRVNGQDY